VLVCCTEREEVANGKADSKVKGKDKAEKKGDDSGSDKEIVKEWRTRSRGLEKGTCLPSSGF